MACLEWGCIWEAGRPTGFRDRHWANGFAMPIAWLIPQRPLKQAARRQPCFSQSVSRVARESSTNSPSTVGGAIKTRCINVPEAEVAIR